MDCPSPLNNCLSELPWLFHWSPLFLSQGPRRRSSTHMRLGKPTGRARKSACSNVLPKPLRFFLWYVWHVQASGLQSSSPDAASASHLQFQLVFAAQPVAELEAQAISAGATEDEVSAALMYCGAFYGNVGNYKSFGDTKFVPAIAPGRFALILKAGAANAEAVDELWEEVKERMSRRYPHRAATPRLVMCQRSAADGGADLFLLTLFSATVVSAQVLAAASASPTWPRSRERHLDVLFVRLHRK